MIKCKAATNGVVIRNNGRLSPCCVFRDEPDWLQNVTIDKIKTVKEYFNLPQVLELQNNLNNDIQDPKCKTCWNLEKTGTGSWRMLCNNILPDSNIGENMLVEIRLGNACNFRCYICRPVSSSKIQQDWIELADDRIFYNMEINDWTKNEDNVRLAREFLGNAKRVSILGGEPFFNKKLWQFLEPILNNKELDEVSITTNGSFIPFEKLSDIPNLLLSFSIDAIGPLSEYSRFDSEWAIVKQNFEQSVANTNIRTHASITISLYNLFALPETLNYIRQVNPHYVHFNFLSEPDYLSITNLHPALKGKAEEMLMSLLADDQNFRLKHALLVVGAEYTKEKFNTFLNYTKQLDSIRGVNLLDYVPEYRNLR